MKALLVSRSERARAWVRGALGPDWETLDARDGLEALRIARDVDVVIADETTVPYGAFGLARDLKFMTDPPAVIILLERAQDTWLARWSGADLWLLQPVDPFALARAAREVAGLPGAPVAAAGAVRGTAGAQPAGVATDAPPPPTDPLVE